MDQATTIKLIEQHILSRHGSHWLTVTSIMPAWKYAFYNPAKKNSEGSVVIKTDNTLLIIYTVLVLFISTLFVISSVHKLLYLSAAAVALLIILKRIYDNGVMTINATGITLNSSTYNWKDYNGAYITSTHMHKNREVQLVLTDSAHRLTFLNITSFGKWNIIGTAIRDFQPVGWKQ